jgi:ankyrin repeat protein
MAEEKRDCELSADLHRRIIKAANALGYSLGEGGTCFGIVQMAIQARLSETFDIFLARLGYISSNDPDTIKTHLASAREKVKKKEKSFLNTNETQALETAAFFEGVYSLQKPQALREINKDRDDKLLKSFKDRESKYLLKKILSGQHFNSSETLKLVQSIAMERSGGLAHHKQEDSLSTYTQAQVEIFFSRWAIAFQHLEQPLALKLTFDFNFLTKGLMHAIAVIYEPIAKGWRFVDPNYLHLSGKVYSNKDLANIIMQKLDISLSEQHRFAKHISRKLKIEQTVSFKVSGIIGGKTQNSENAAKAIDDFYNMQFAHPLLFAAYFNQLDDVKNLLANGANPNMLENGRTPLGIAITQKNTPLTQLLLKSGADPNPHFIKIIRSRSHQLLETFTKCSKFNSALLNKPFDEKSTWANPLDYLIFQAYFENQEEENNNNAELDYQPIILNLLKAGADPNALDSRNDTPLVNAVKYGLKQITTELLKHKGNPNQKNKEGDTLLLIALKARNLDMVNLLLAGEANPNTPGADGISPLYFAIANEDLDTTNALLKAGAIPTDACKELAALSDKIEIKSTAGTSSIAGKSSFAVALTRLGTDVEEAEQFLKNNDGQKSILAKKDTTSVTSSTSITIKTPTPVDSPSISPSR